MPCLRKEEVIDARSMMVADEHKNLTAGILALTMGILRADLFDSLDELTAKYGKPVSAIYRDRINKYTFQSGDYQIEAWIENANSPGAVNPDRCVYQRHIRVDRKTLGSAEIKAILKRGYKRGEWKYVGSDKWRLLNIGEAKASIAGYSVTQRRKR